MDPKLATWNKSITFQSELIVIIQSCTVEWIPKELSKKAKSNPLVIRLPVNLYSAHHCPVQNQ